MTRPITALSGAAALALCACSPALAEPDLFGRDAFSGLIDLRAAADNGPQSFLYGGVGKTRFGSTRSGDFQGHLVLADAALVWQPQLTWALGATIDAEHQQGQQTAVDLVQGYLTYRPRPIGGLRISARAGLFYPPISQEHEGPTWSVVHTITPSAINTWVGEEVKVVGGEARITGKLGEHELTATGGLFGFNDTSGALLAFRGWGLHDVKAGAFSDFRLPPLDAYMAQRQPPFTSSTIELAGNVGYYARLDWRPPGRFTVNAFYYDNNGDKVSLNNQLQWSWATQFWNFGAAWDLDDDTRLMSQVMTGQSLMGYPNGRSVWINIGYTSAYLLASRNIGGKSAVAGRVEYFETSDRNFRPAIDDPSDNRGESGWAFTGSYRYQISAHARLMIEAMQGDWQRPSLSEAGLPPKERQTMVQSSIRLTF
jgi:hypothetical protein